MRRSITYTLLITCVLLFSSCKTQFSKISYEAKNLSVSDSMNSLDSEVVQIYLPYKNILEKDMNRVISMSNYEMIKDKPESNLTNFLADLLLTQGEKIAVEENFSVEPDMSFFNYGGIRSYLPKGEITVENIFELMPFENEMVYLRLTGSQVHDFLDVVAKNGGDSVGGVQFVISNEKAKNIKIGGEPIDEDKEYWLVTNDYVANGGDDMEVLTGSSEFINSGVKIRDVIISYMEDKQAKGENLAGKKDGRISYE